jgi:DNA modification methylase
VKDEDKYYFDERPWMKQTKKQQEAREYLYSNPAYENKGLSKSSCMRNKQNDYQETIEHSWRIIPVGAKQSGFELAGKKASEHIAPYPEELIRPYIRSLCPANGTVCDPFLGSGTTMRVALEEGRNCIGIELNEKSINYAKKRVNFGAGLAEYSEAV